MSKGNADTPIGKRVRKAAVTVWDSVLWVIVLSVILAISGYSLFYVARKLGVPAVFAIGMSTVFDGSALIMAGLSLKYAEEGMSGGGPRMAVRALALLSAYLQALHVMLGHESRSAIPLWSSLPIIAALVFDFQTRWIRRKALARQGMTYPSQLPAIGTGTWLLYPGEALKDIRKIIKSRKDALIAAARLRMEDYVDATETDMGKRKRDRRTQPKLAQPEPVAALEPGLPEAAPQTETDPAANGPEQPVTATEPVTETESEPTPVTEPDNGTEQVNRTDELSVRRTERSTHAPNRHKRDWVRDQGFEVPTSGRTPQWVIDKYDEAHPEERDA